MEVEVHRGSKDKNIDGSCHSSKGCCNPPSLLRHPTLDPACPHFLKSLCPHSSVLFHPLLRYFRQFFPPSRKSPTNLSWFKQILKRQIYQVTVAFYYFLSILIFYIALQLGYFNLWDIFRFLFRLLRMTFFHKIMAQKIIFLQMHKTILQRVK